jgi:hypothetical protein
MMSMSIRRFWLACMPPISRVASVRHYRIKPWTEVPLPNVSNLIVRGIS